MLSGALCRSDVEWLLLILTFLSPLLQDGMVVAVVAVVAAALAAATS